MKGWPEGIATYDKSALNIKSEASDIPAPLFLHKKGAKREKRR